jgi:hypothetical protein
MRKLLGSPGGDRGGFRGIQLQRFLWLGLLFLGSSTLNAGYVYSLTSTEGAGFQFTNPDLLTTSTTITSWDSCSTGSGPCKEIDFVFQKVNGAGMDRINLPLDIGHVYFDFLPAGWIASGPGVYQTNGDSFTGTLTIQAQDNSVPEPATVMIVLVGLAALGVRDRFGARFPSSQGRSEISNSKRD